MITLDFGAGRAVIDGAELALSNLLTPAVLAAMPADYANADWRRLHIADDGSSEAVDRRGTLTRPGNLATLAEAVRAAAPTSAASRSASNVAAARIKAECGRRIVSVVKDAVTQSNIAAHALGLVAKLAQGEPLTPAEQADVVIAEKLRAWVAAMQARCRTYVADANTVCGTDDAWPTPPSGARAFADRF